MRLLFVAGLGGSGPNHWQSLWRRLFWDTHLVEHEDWHAPEAAAWIGRLHAAVRDRPERFLIAHGLGCATVACLVEKWPSMSIRGALLVCPTDVESGSHDLQAHRSFAPMPLAPFAFPVTVVASENDPLVKPSRARSFANAWGGQFVNVGPCGHLNVESGHGPWPRGTELLVELVERARMQERTARRSAQ